MGLGHQQHCFDSILPEYICLSTKYLMGMTAVLFVCSVPNPLTELCLDMLMNYLMGSVALSPSGTLLGSLCWKSIKSCIEKNVVKHFEHTFSRCGKIVLSLSVAVCGVSIMKTTTATVAPTASTTTRGLNNWLWCMERTRFHQISVWFWMNFGDWLMPCCKRV